MFEQGADEASMGQNAREHAPFDPVAVFAPGPPAPCPKVIATLA
jgi:hypothetical protein